MSEMSESDIFIVVLSNTQQQNQLQLRKRKQQIINRLTGALFMKARLLLTNIFLWSVLLLIASWQGAGAQNYVTIPGTPGGQQRTNYFYEYNYPNLTQYIFGYYAYYDYYNRGYDEFIILAADMKRAGLCSGPLAGLGMQFIHVPKEYQGSMRIFIKSIGNKYLHEYNYRIPGGRPYYYTYCIQRNGTSVKPMN